MSSLAMIAHMSGFAVTGSDASDSASVRRLEAEGIKIYRSHSAENVKGCDMVIYTAAIHDDNPELSAARNANIKCMTRAEYLGRLMIPYEKRIGVSGTHGKSTTTSMLSVIALSGKVDPTIISGAEVIGLNSAYRMGDKNYFIFEACEYTDSFLSFYPTTALVLNIEHEHVDYFPDIDAVKKSFRKYMSIAEIAVVSADSGYALDAAVGYDGMLITYSLNYGEKTEKEIKERGLDPIRHYYAKDISFIGEGSSYILAVKDSQAGCEKNLCRIDLHLPGNHNISNSVAAAASAIENGISVDAVAEGLSRFSGTRRRFEYIGKTVNGADIYDDYAHHPTEIKATLSAARKRGRKIWCVFQPHTYSRTASLFNELTEAFSDADNVIFTDIYSAGRESNIYGVSSEDLARATKNAIYIEKGKDFSRIADFINENAKEGDIVFTMGAGDITKLGRLISREK